MAWTTTTSTRRYSQRSGTPDSGIYGRRHRPDYWLVALCAVLLGIGLIVVYAIGPALSESRGVSSMYYVDKQLIAIALSGVAFLVMSRVPLGFIRRMYKPVLVLAAIATLVALVMPVNPNYPAHRWVRFGSLSFQSVELLKFAILLWFAGFLAEHIQNRTLGDGRRILTPILIAVGIIGVIVAGAQSDLGSAGVIIAILAAMVFVAGLPMKRILLILAVIGIGGLLAITSTPYRRERVTAFLNPESNCQTASGWQACQALIAVGSGGMVGLGLGRSVQAYGYLPEAANDSIFAIYAEKFGFIGSILLLAVFVAFFARMKKIAEHAPDDFTRLIVVGIFTWFGVQTLVNIGAMIGLLPLKGITLPFISYGGTSVVFLAAAVGLVFQISRYTSYTQLAAKERGTYDNSHDRRRIRGAYHPDFSGRS